MHPLRTAKSPKPLSSHTPFGMRQELTKNKFPLGVGHRKCEHSTTQTKESVFERHQHVNTLGTGPVPYSWLYLQGLAWYRTIYKCACWERSDWKENGKLPKTSKFSQSPGMVVKGNCHHWEIFILLDSTETASCSPATTPKLCLCVTPHSTSNLSTKIET